jgi:hypothetical protein
LFYQHLVSCPKLQPSPVEETTDRFKELPTLPQTFIPL